MPLNFYDAATGEKIGSTRLASNVLAAATAEIDPALRTKILATKKWRKQYLGVYRDLTKCEFYQEQNLLEIARVGLVAIAESVRDEQGRNLTQIVEAGWSGRAQVETFIIGGTGEPVPLRIPKIATLTDAAQIWSHEHLAEPGLVSSFKFLDAHKKLTMNSDVLVALAGGAEYGPTKHWLALGGTVAVAARSNETRWAELIKFARESAGTLIVPVLKRKVEDESVALTDEVLAANAGFDLAEDAEALASWVAALSVTRKERIVLGQYAYAPGAKHIYVQAVQDALADILCKKLAPTRVALAWLATPTDSTAVPAEVLQDALDRYASRSAKIKLRDFILGMRKTNGEFFETRFGEKLAVIDPTSTLQGSSYALAKRSQRWRAYLANSRGIKVSYVVAPPARTESVFSFRLLRATFRGAPSFGVQAFKVRDASLAATALLIRDLNGPMHQRGSTALHTESAIHGGLWRMIYLPKSVWNKATLIGWKALFTGRSQG